MGEYYTKNDFGEEVRNFTPDNDENNLYFDADLDMASLLRKVNIHWPGIDLSEINLCAEHIQISGLSSYYYDSSDYGDFIHVWKKDDQESN